VRGTRRSDQLLALDRNAMQEAAFAVIIIDGESARSSGCPRRLATPSRHWKRQGEFRARNRRGGRDKSSSGARLLLGPAVEPHGKPRVDVKAPYGRCRGGG